MKKYKTKVSFWATKRGESFKDKEAEKIYNKLMKIEDELAKIREKIWEVYTKPRRIVFPRKKPKRVVFYKRKSKKNQSKR